MKTDKELVIEFAKTWNNSDVSYIHELLNDDFHYASQWVFTEITNKKDYLAYLDGKFKVLKSSKIKLIAELGMHNEEYCLVISQIKDRETTKVTFLIKSNYGKIIRADMCAVPPPESVKLSGIIPK